MVASMTISWLSSAGLRHRLLESDRQLAEVVDQIGAFGPNLLRVGAKLVQPGLGLVAQVLDLLLREPQVLRSLCPRIRDDPLRLGSRLSDVNVRLGLRTVCCGA